MDTLPPLIQHFVRMFRQTALSAKLIEERDGIGRIDAKTLANLASRAWMFSTARVGSSDVTWP